jgi:hypothetical protein
MPRIIGRHEANERGLGAARGCFFALLITAGFVAAVALLGWYLAKLLEAG